MFVAEKYQPPINSFLLQSDSNLVNRADLKISRPIWSNDNKPVEKERISSTLEKKLGFGFDVLREVEILRASLERGNGIHDSASIRYALENEFTAAFEATQDSGYLWSNHRQWDPENEEFLAFGSSFLGLLDSGITDIEDQISAGKPEYRFELDRRIAEYDNEQKLRKMVIANNLSDGVLFTISAFPEEFSSDLVKELGYKPDERLAKMRFELFSGGVRQTIEISVQNSEVFNFKKLLTNLGIGVEEVNKIDSSLSLLRSQNRINFGGDSFQTILDTVKIYDNILQEQTGKQHFCGKVTHLESEKDYDSLVARQRRIRENGQLFISHIHDVNVDLAESFYDNGNLSPSLKTRLNHWLYATKNGEEFILSDDERSLITNSLASCTISREVAFSLKKNELIRVWSLLSCVINEERAEKLFGVEFVQNTKHSFESSGANLDPQLLYLAGQMASKVNAQFVLCGGSVQSKGTLADGNLFNLTLEDASDNLFRHTPLNIDSDLETNTSCGVHGCAIDKIHFHCPGKDGACNHAIVGTDTCGKCGLTATQWAEQTGTKVCR